VKLEMTGFKMLTTIRMSVKLSHVSASVLSSCIFTSSKIKTLGIHHVL